LKNPVKDYGVQFPQTEIMRHMKGFQK